MTSGMDLKVERIRAKVTATDLASEMGVSRQRVSQLESATDVSEAMADRYRAALLSVAGRVEEDRQAVPA